MNGTFSSELLLVDPARLVWRLLQLGRLLIELEGGSAVLAVARQVEPVAAFARGRRVTTVQGRVLMLLLLVR